MRIVDWLGQQRMGFLGLFQEQDVQVGQFDRIIKVHGDGMRIWDFFVDSESWNRGMSESQNQHRQAASTLDQGRNQCCLQG